MKNIILNNIFTKDFYYYDYKLNNGMLSWFFIPLSYIILYYKTYIKHFSYIFIIIAFIGIIETILLLKTYNYVILITSSMILHGILFYPLTNIKKFLKLNISNSILGFLAIFIVLYLPYWPYILSRNIFIILILLIYSFLFLLHKFNK